MSCFSLYIVLVGLHGVNNQNILNTILNWGLIFLDLELCGLWDGEVFQELVETDAVENKYLFLFYCFLSLLHRS